MKSHLDNVPKINDGASTRGSFSRIVLTVEGLRPSRERDVDLKLCKP